MMTANTSPAHRAVGTISVRPEDTRANRILTVLAQSDPPAFRRALAEFAKQGDWETLQLALRGGAVATAQSATNASNATSCEFFYSILPILVHAPGDVAEQVIQEWRSAFGGVDATALQDRLGNIASADVARGLMLMGAHPNGPHALKLGNQSTALVSAYGQSVSSEGLFAMLDWLIERDELPLRWTPGSSTDNSAETDNSFFSYLLEQNSVGHGPVAVLDYLLTLDLPESWQMEIARVLSDFARTRPERSSGSPSFEAFGRMLGLARFGAASEWINVLESGRIDRDWAMMLATWDGNTFKPPEGLTTRIVHKLLEDGVDPNKLYARSTVTHRNESRSEKSPFLHTCISFGNVDLARLLLNGGADPLAKTDVRQEDAFEVARRTAARVNDAPLVMLEAWRARKSMADVMRRTPSGP